MKPRGFILAATLWILAILTIAAGYFTDRVARSVALAQQRQDAAAQMVAFADTRADLLYRLATSPIGLAGLGTVQPIALDDRAYRTPAGDTIRLQDNRGLVNVNFVQPALVQGLLANLGVPLPKRDAMLDTLLDYTDEDSLRRLNGAEAAEYSSRGMPLPPNDWLNTPAQVRNILGWHEQAELWEKRHLARFLTTARVSGFNPNTAPVEILASIPGVTLQTARTLAVLRASRPMTSLADLPGLIPGTLDPEQVQFSPSWSLRVVQQSRKVPWALEFNITLTPASPDGPWRIDYLTRTVVSYAVENEAEIPILPPRASASIPAAASP